MKFAYIDIGELGFSMYLSAHIKWLKNQGQLPALVMTYPGRKCLYEGWAEKVISIPDEFYKDFDINCQHGFKISDGTDKKMNSIFRDYFNEKLPKGYCVAEDLNFDATLPQEAYPKERFFIPYPYKEELIGKKEILVFTRFRNYPLFNRKDFPKKFWIDLIEILCTAFPNCIVRAMGTKNGAYNITEIERVNYINFVGKTSDFQKVLDRCQLAIGAVGIDSGPLKFTQLQGLPTFVINWNESWVIHDACFRHGPFQFYKTDLSQHKTFNDTKAVIEAVSFLEKNK